MINQELMDNKATLFALQTSFLGYNLKQVAELMNNKGWIYGKGIKQKEWEAHDVKYLLTGWDVFKARSEAITVLKESNSLMRVLEGGLDK